jgi:hypothetical protein
MLDTTSEMQNMQRIIIYKKTATERFLIGDETISFGRIMVENNIKQLQPQISDLELKILVFKRYYENIFSEEEMEAILNSMKNYLKKNN